MQQTPPSKIEFHKQSQQLGVYFSEHHFLLSAEYLRVYSPSAEVRGHGGGPIKLVSGKKAVKIIGIEPVGHYAIKLTFDDGHDSGLYTWQTLFELGDQYEQNWADYLQRLEQANEARESLSISFVKAD